MQKQELNFFKELDYFFTSENKYFLIVFLISAPLIMFLSYYFIHWIAGVSFILGYIEFLLTFYLCRKLFVLTMTRMNLKKDTAQIKDHNWKLFLRFLNSDLLIFNMSTSVLSTFTILLIFNK